MPPLLLVRLLADAMQAAPAGAQVAWTPTS
jgi:hypothetical protein